jgi:hypothetical protein
MRRQHKTNTAANLLASKRIAVAFCAAVAMVLGAMSVGATLHSYPGNDNPDGVPQGAVATVPTHANTALIMSGSSGQSSPNATQIITESKNLPQEHLLTPILIAAPKKSNRRFTPLLVIPNIVSQTSLTLGPLSISANVSNDTVQLNTSLTSSVNVQVPTSLPNILPDSGDTSGTPASDPTTNDNSTGTGTTTGSGTDSTTTTPPSTDPTSTDPSTSAPLTTMANTVQDTVSSLLPDATN